jgi:hypothetical protein
MNPFEIVVAGKVSTGTRGGFPFGRSEPSGIPTERTG